MTASQSSPFAAATRFGVPGELIWDALAATRAAALAAARLAGAGDAKAADAAATDALRAALSTAASAVTVVTGEGAKDGAPMLADGERIGYATTTAGIGCPSAAEEFDLAVDPLECTDLCAKGLPGAWVALAVAPRGALWEPGPAFYMDKLVVGPAARGAARLCDPPELTVANVARALDRPVRELRVIVLHKPRHRDLIATLHATGATVITPDAGDVAGALSALLPGGGADLLLGIGGTPEGVLAACAARALGGEMQARLAPQRDDERDAVAAAGMSTVDVLELHDLVGADATFIATGVTGGLVSPPHAAHGWLHTESLVIARGTVQRIHHSTPTEE